MPVRGKVYVVPLPDEKSWQLVVHNTGDRTFGVTQNILPSNNPNMTAHDDHSQYGHGMGVAAHIGINAIQELATNNIIVRY